MKSKKENRKTVNKKKVLMVLSIIFAVICSFLLINMIVNLVVNSKTTEYAASFEKVQKEDVIVPEKDENGNWTFTTDRELKVMQLTDIHIGGGWLSLKQDKMALNAVASMITAEKPDLVIITGDLVYPVPYESLSVNNLAPAKILTTLMESLGVYWIPTFGNHDTEFYSTHTREDVSEFYSSEDLKYCLFQAGDENIDGYGNSVINVKNTQGIITQSIFTLDSHAYTGKGLISIIKMDYDHIKQNQVDWYKTTLENNCKYNVDLINSLDVENKSELLDKYSNINSLLFFHIPLQEYADAWFEYVDNGYQDTEDVKLLYGTAGEEDDVVFCGVEPDNLFETMLELDGKKAIFCGHDHVNNFSINYKGILLNYGLSIDYIAYKDIDKMGSQRGCTIITIKPDGDFDIVRENYYQDKYPTLGDFQKESVEMQELNPDHN